MQIIQGNKQLSTLPISYHFPYFPSISAVSSSNILFCLPIHCECQTPTLYPCLNSVYSGHLWQLTVYEQSLWMFCQPGRYLVLLGQPVCDIVQKYLVNFMCISARQNIDSDLKLDSVLSLRKWIWYVNYCDIFKGCGIWFYVAFWCYNCLHKTLKNVLYFYNM